MGELVSWWWSLTELIAVFSSTVDCSSEPTHRQLPTLFALSLEDAFSFSCQAAKPPQARWYRSMMLSKHILHIASCAQWQYAVIKERISTLFCHGCRLMVLYGCVIHVWFFSERKVWARWQVANVFLAESADIMVANAAKMEKHFRPPRQGRFYDLHCLRFARLHTEDSFFFFPALETQTRSIFFLPFN